MRKLLVILSAVFMLFVTGCPNSIRNKKFAPDLRGIKNFSNYSSVGIATKDLSNSRSVARISTNDEVDVIVGLNKYTEIIEELEYESSGEKQDLFVYHYKDSTPFLIVQFVKENVTGDRFINNDTWASPIYFISKKTGKIYQAEDILFEYIHNSNDFIYLSGNNIFISGKEQNINKDYIYKVTEEDNLLGIEQYCHLNLLKTDECILASDIYGNIINTTNGKYLTASKQLRTAWYDVEWFLGYDGKLYSLGNNGNCVSLDKNGNEYFVKYSSDDGIYTINENTSESDEFFLSDGLDYYYYRHNEENKSCIYKVSFEDSTKMRSAITTIKQLPGEQIRKYTKFFYLNNSNQVVCFDMEKNSEEIITIDNFTVESLEDVNGGIECKGWHTDSLSNSCIFIDEDTLEITEQNLRKRSFSKIVYISPLN